MLKTYNKEIFVSVIMPVYNTNHTFISKSIESILKQSHKNFEFIIIDDCSNDSLTINVLKRFDFDNRVRVVFNKKREGIAYSLNKGLSLAKGKYIFRMDSDDISKLRRLEFSIDYMEKNSQISILGTNGVFLGGKKSPIIMPRTDVQIKYWFLFTSSLIHPSIVFRKDFIDAHSIRYNSVASQDYELWIRCLTNYNCKFYNLRKLLINYRFHDNQITKTNSINNNNTFELSRLKLQKFYNLTDDNKDFLKLMSLTSSQFQMNNFNFYKKQIMNIINKITNNKSEKRELLNFIIFQNTKITLKTINYQRLILVFASIALKNQV